MYLHDVLSRWMVTYLTGQISNYARRVPNDLESLRDLLQPGDVVLVEGGARISQLIMYVTQSSWSHASMYVGDALLRWGGPEADKALEAYGEEATRMLIESDLREGVRAVPLSTYEPHNIRICRPVDLRPWERERILTEMLSHLGLRYDTGNVFDLARYLLPFHFLPRRWRRRSLYLGSSSSREIICSALIAKAFYKVGFAIQQPLGPSPLEPGPIKVRHPSYIMPRDFDLSTNFQILKVHQPQRRG
jgi:hypothetical protein